MAEMFSAIWSWLKRGYNLAVNSTKWIWAGIMEIFEKAMDAFKSITTEFQAFFSYSSKRSWREEDGAVVKVCYKNIKMS